MDNIVKDTMHFIKSYKELNSEITHKIEIYFSQGTTNVRISIYVHTYTMKVNNIQKIMYQANINYTENRNVAFKKHSFKKKELTE